MGFIMVIWIGYKCIELVRSGESCGMLFWWGVVKWLIDVYWMIWNKLLKCVVKLKCFDRNIVWLML